MENNTSKNYNPIAEAYVRLVKLRDGDQTVDLDEVIRYLGEALAD